jgi:hypothetical protein
VRSRANIMAAYSPAVRVPHRSPARRHVSNISPSMARCKPKWLTALTWWTMCDILLGARSSLHIAALSEIALSLSPAVAHLQAVTRSHVHHHHARHVADDHLLGGPEPEDTITRGWTCAKRRIIPAPTQVGTVLQGNASLSSPISGSSPIQA